MSMHIDIHVEGQVLTLFEAGRAVADWPVSTAAAGVGEKRGSNRTPRGRHVIRAKIGAGLPSGAVLAGRRWTGEVCTPEAFAAEPERDWILTRILWLSGLERGRNRLGEVDTMRRFIYIHGCPDTLPVGVPGSHGCIRMRNDAVIELFERAPVGTTVTIHG